MKIVIFGTGSCCEQTLQKLDTDKVEIVGFCDNNVSKQRTMFHGKMIYPPNELPSLEYDYILLASEYGYEIYKQLTAMGLNMEKVVPVLQARFTKDMGETFKSVMSSLLKTEPIRQRDKKRIALLRVNNSGSNTYALHKLLPGNLKDKYEIRVVSRSDLDEDHDYDMICSTSISSYYHPSIINVQLWHGFPLKKIGTRTELFYNSYSDYVKNNTDKIISYSELYSSLYNASFPNSPDKYEICGMPRNDFLFHKNDELMVKLFGENVMQKKTIFFLPTYRTWKVDLKANGNRSWDNLFGFETFNLEQFAEFLRANDLFLICKLHHMEYNQLELDEYSPYSDVIRFLREEELYEHDIDLYEILAGADLLVTDYSSVYFDVLLIDIPIVFVPVDLDNYKANRGFNMEPYEFWAPGHKAFDQNELTESIVESLASDPYQKNRRTVRDIVHAHQDDRSHVRVWNLLDRLLEERDRP